MASCYVTGIAPTDDVSELEKLLGAVEGVDRSKLSVITKADRSSEHDSSFLDFIHLDDDRIMTNLGGTGLPGINLTGSRLGYLGTPHVESRLGTLPIPDDEAGNYNDALDAGRSVVAYDCTNVDSAAVEAAFRSAGVRHVKAFS